MTYCYLNVKNCVDFETDKTILPINKLDLNPSPKNLRAKFILNLSKRFAVLTFVHSHGNKIM